MADATGGHVEAGTAQDRLALTAHAAIRLYASLEELVQHPMSHQRGEHRTVISHSSPPWHAKAAYMVFELNAMARMLESALRAASSGAERPRGSSQRNTVLALTLLPALAVAATEDPVRYAAGRLDGWCHRARIALGEVEPPKRLPRQPGHPEPRCPWCQRESLRHQPLSGLVRCVNPGCMDDQGRRPLGRIELGRLSESIDLVWQDGTTGLDLEII